MEQLFFVEAGRVEWRDIAQPEIVDEQDALVRPIAVATCDLDTGQIFGRTPFPGPFPLGHEGVGEVVAVGDAVTNVAVGQRVIIPFQISCGTCPRCARGLTASCKSVNPGAMYGLEPYGGPWGGFLSDVVRVPWADHMLIPLPDGIDPVVVASLSDNIPDGWRVIAPYVDDPPNASVLMIVSEAVSVPFYAIAVAKALGIERIDYLEFGPTLPGQADKAARVGANVLSGPEKIGRNYTVTSSSARDVDALHLAIRATEPDGTCFVGGDAFFGNDAVPIPLFRMYTRGVRLVTGRVNARVAMPKVLDLIMTNGLRPELVTDAVVPWGDAADALVAEPRKLVIHR